MQALGELPPEALAAHAQTVVAPGVAAAAQNLGLFRAPLALRLLQDAPRGPASWKDIPALSRLQEERARPNPRSPGDAAVSRDAA